jgi:hypothetical protein
MFLFIIRTSLIYANGPFLNIKQHQFEPSQKKIYLRPLIILFILGAVNKISRVMDSINPASGFYFSWLATPTSVGGN